MGDGRAVLTVSNVRKFYGTTEALKGVSLEVHEGEFLALVGPSGCGKTTLLKIIGGFEDLDAGEVRLFDVDMAGVPARDRPTRMVFQRLALFPHMTVSDNIAFPLRAARKDRAEIGSRIAEMLRLMELSPDYLGRYPRELSGGEQQRVALARCLVSGPSLVLLDEPLSALDVKLRKVLQEELKRLHRSLGVTFVHVTHDLEEALILSDRICVMRSGEIQQTGRPLDIYFRPSNSFVASFIGDTNIFDVSVIETDGETVEVQWPAERGRKYRIAANQAAGALRPGAARMMVRPERMRPTETGSGAFELVVRISDSFNHGPNVKYVAHSVEAGLRVVFDLQGAAGAAYEIGCELPLVWNSDDVFVFNEAI